MVKISTESPVGALPVTRFRGMLAAPPEEQNGFGVEKTADDGTRQYTVAELGFTDVEVIETSEPYPWPTIKLSISYKPPQESRGGTKFEAMAHSVRKLGITLDDLIGKTQEWAVLPAIVRSQITDAEGEPKLDGNGKQLWGDVKTPCWQIVSAEGVGSTEEAEADFDAMLLELADGKTDKQFYTAALEEQTVRDRPDVVTSITDREILQPLIAAGRLTRDDDGILRKAS